MMEGEEKIPISRPGALYCGQVSLMILGALINFIIEFISLIKKN